MKTNLITVVGPTATGKSSLAVALAKKLDGEIVSADSRQVYIGLDIGTGKVTSAEMQGIPHHLIDIKHPNESFSLAEFQQLAYQTIDSIASRGKLPILAGGTGLYSRAVAEGYNLTGDAPDPERRKYFEALSREEAIRSLQKLGVAVSDPALTARQLVRRLEKAEQGVAAERESSPRYRVLQLGLTWPRGELYRRIGVRLDARIKGGLIEEVETLRENGATDGFLEGLGLEYRFILRYLKGGFASFTEFYDALFQAIRHFAKRQTTWYRKEHGLIWLDITGDYTAEAERLIREFLRAE